MEFREKLLSNILLIFGERLKEERPRTRVDGNCSL